MDFGIFHPNNQKTSKKTPHIKRIFDLKRQTDIV
jgi:hypothetical protein